MKKEKVYQLCVISIILDQFIKLLIRMNLKLEDSITVIPKFFKLYYLQNKGAAFSKFSGMKYLLILIGIVTLFAIANYLSKNKLNSKIEGISIGIIMGGLVGNLVDRILYGYVIDYLSFTMLGYPFAVFNLADTLIVIGVFLLGFIMIRSDYSEFKSRRRNKRKN